MNKWHVNYASAKEKDREWKEARRRILKRDRYRCRVQDCHVKGAKNLTVHHIIPRDQGGDNRDLNLITLCPKHHDEIEVAEIRLVPLIEAWEGYEENRTDTEDATSIILAYADGMSSSTQDRAFKKHAQIQPVEKRAPRHRCSDSTVQAIDTLLIGSSLAEIAKVLGYPPQFASTLSAILHYKPGAISAKREDDLRGRLGLAQIIPAAIARSDKAPQSDVPVLLLKREPPVRKKIAPVEKPVVITESVDEAEDYPCVFLDDNDEWIEVQRKDTTIGIRVSDAGQFDTLAEMAGASKADMFSEILTFYLQAHAIEFVECTESEYEVWLNIYRLVMSTLKPSSHLDARIITEAIADFGASQNADLKSIDADFLKDHRKDFLEFVEHWSIRESKRAWTSSC